MGYDNSKYRNTISKNPEKKFEKSSVDRGIKTNRADDYKKSRELRMARMGIKSPDGDFSPSSLEIEKRRREMDEKMIENNTNNAKLGNSLKQLYSKENPNQYRKDLVDARNSESVQDEGGANGGKSGGRGKGGEAAKMEKAVQDLAKAAIKPGGIGWALFKQIEFLVDWMLLFPLFLAIVKDIIDWIGFSLPGLNESFNFLIGTLLCLVLMVMGSASASRKTSSTIKKNLPRWFTIIAGVSLEEFFGVNFLPIETIMVIVAYVFLLLERFQTAEEAKREGSPSTDMEGEYA